MQVQFSENGKILTQEEAEKAGVAKRYNTGKLDWTLMPIDAMESELRVWSYGRKKYPRDDRDPNSNRILGNWEKLWGEDTIPLSLACAMRHLTAMLKGEMVDQESGEYHAAHVRANMAPIIRYLNQKP